MCALTLHTASATAVAAAAAAHALVPARCQLSEYIEPMHELRGTTRAPTTSSTF